LTETFSPWSDSPHGALLFSERFCLEAFPPWSSILLSEVLPGDLLSTKLTIYNESIDIIVISKTVSAA
jgi:hypothetical protein